MAGVASSTGQGLTAASTSANGLTSVAGLSSGINWQPMIDAMITADRAATAKQEARQATFQSRLDAVRLYNTKLLSFQLDLSAINRSSVFNVRSATSSNTSALTATASSTAAPGTYQFDVVSTAKAHQLALSGIASNSTTNGAGTVELQLGSGGTTSIPVSDANSSLDGIAAAINNANAGVTASVINDGSATPYRLMLTSKSTGTANAITVSGTGALAAMFATKSDLQAATNASVRIGGATGITVSQSSNTFTNILPGLSLTAQQGGVNGVSITVGTDTSGVKTQIQTLVDSFNNVAQFIKDYASYDATTKTAGLLFSESDVRSRFQDITASMLSSIKAQGSSNNTLSSIGIGIDQDTGQLTLDSTQLDAALTSDPTSVMKLFTSSGVSSDSGIAYSVLSDKTDVSSPFQVAITQAASQARSSGTALGATTVIDSDHSTLSLTVNNHLYQLSLTPGSYSAQALTDHLQAVLDQGITPKSDKLKVSLSGGALSVATNGYGSSMALQINSFSSAASLLQLDTAAKTGTDVAGTINGVAGTGTGQTLVGAAGTAAEGLKLVVTAAAPVASATMTVTKGLAQLVSQRVKMMTDSSSGALVTKQSALQKTIDDLTTTIAANDARLAARRLRYQTQFMAMETTIAKLNSDNSYFTSQVKSWQSSNN